jgi:hypothetical protein
VTIQMNVMIVFKITHNWHAPASNCAPSISTHVESRGDVSRRSPRHLHRRCHRRHWHMRLRSANTPRRDREGGGRRCAAVAVAADSRDGLCDGNGERECVRGGEKLI